MLHESPTVARGTFAATLDSIVSILYRLSNMPAVKTLSDFPLRNGFLRLATAPRTTSGFKQDPTHVSALATISF